ncbi:DNA polymerase III subunit beta [Anaerotalea alkaliphila]|uniref:Beta sliding clamp n=1 Tax=Anaerotalea alkaliphila TaxID=2662126 RepID=A0A7X5HWT8_9FIRM|nr:DNA polymerase III subunit beta [Anaerotalea alkaliphila]NDL68092.1 DNA polymerase III subunit beta [Anaerotalea alkaliphila]
MKIICSQEQLQLAVNTVLKAVSSRTTMSILQCILLEAGDGLCKLVGNDLELGIESMLDAQILEKGAIAIDAKMFAEIVRKLPNQDVTLSMSNRDENHILTITCGKSEFNIPGQPAEEFVPLPAIVRNQPLRIPQGELKEMIRQTIFSIAIEETRPALTGELLEVKQGNFHLVSIDGYRASFRKLPMSREFEETSCIIPGKTLNEIKNILSNEEDDMVALYFTGKHVVFELNGSVVVSRLLQGEFPKYENIFTSDYSTKIHVNRKELLMGIERAALVARESKKNPIKVSIQDTGMVISSNTELGNAHEEIDIQLEGNPLEIAFNPKYMIDALKVMEDESIVLQFNGSVNPCIIHQEEGDLCKYLILPIRLN